MAVYDGQVLAETTWRAGRKQSASLLRVVDQCLRLTEVERTDLRAIALASGPGSYSGLRVGASTAIGLALSLGVEVVQVPTLEVLAYSLGPNDLPLRPAIEVGRGRYASALFGRTQDGLEQRGEIESSDLRTLLDRARTEGSLVIGDFEPIGLSGVLLDLAPAPVVATPASSFRRAGFLAELAARRLGEGRPPDELVGQLIYLNH